MFGLPPLRHISTLPSPVERQSRAIDRLAPPITAVRGRTSVSGLTGARSLRSKMAVRREFPCYLDALWVDRRNTRSRRSARPQGHAHRDVEYRSGSENTFGARRPRGR